MTHWASPLLKKAGVKLKKEKGKSWSKARTTKASDGTLCPSALHCAVYEMLLLRQRAGEIENIRHEQKTHICGDLYWHVDYVVFDKLRGVDVGFEAKGREFERYRAQVQAWRGVGPFDVEIWVGDWRRPKLKKTIRGK